MRNHIVFLFILVLCAGCGSDSSRSFYVPPNDPGTFVMYDVADPPTLDPARSWGFFDGGVVALIFSNLVRFGTDAEILPDLAQRWEISDDGREYIFFLNAEAAFSNGRSVTADDVKYSFERVLDPDTAAANRWVLEKIQEIVVVDPHTLKVVLTQPFTPFISLLAMPAAAVVPKEAVTACEAEGIPFGEKPVGSGPWILKEWAHDQHIKLVRNENYWSTKPKIKNITYRIIVDPFTAIAEFETGNLSVIDPLPTREILRWKTHPQWSEYVSLASQLTLDMIVFNTERPGFDNVEVRRAMSQLLEMPLVMECVLEGAGVLANGPVPKRLPGGDPDREAYPHNPEQAVQVLKDAGMFDREIVFLLPSRENFIRTLGEVVHAEWRRLGLNVKLLQAEWVTYKRMLLDGKFDVGFQNWYADYPDGDNFLYPLFHSSQIGLVNCARLNDPQIDAKIEASQREMDVEKRTAMLEELNQSVYELAPALFLWYRAKYIVTQPWVRNYRVPLVFNGTKYLQEEIVTTAE